MPRDSSRDHRERSTYLITFSCYGCRLHGDESGSVDLGHNAVESPLVEADPMRVAAEQGLMDQAPYCMERRHREVVLASLRERCSERQWTLLAAHVRTSHLHIVVKADARPERVMNDLKSYASRCLNRGWISPRESGGHGTEAQGGWASGRTCRQRFGMWLTSRAIRWLSLRRVSAGGNRSLWSRLVGRGGAFRWRRVIWWRVIWWRVSWRRVSWRRVLLAMR